MFAHLERLAQCGAHFNHFVTLYNDMMWLNSNHDSCLGYASKINYGFINKLLL